MAISEKKKYTYKILCFSGKGHTQMHIYVHVLHIKCTGLWSERMIKNLVFRYPACKLFSQLACSPCLTYPPEQQVFRSDAWGEKEENRIKQDFLCCDRWLCRVFSFVWGFCAFSCIQPSPWITLFCTPTFQSVCLWWTLSIHLKILLCACCVFAVLCVFTLCLCMSGS